VEGKAIAAVFIGGGIGAAIRYVVGAAMLQRFGAGLPWSGTLLINVTGSFLIGVIAQFALTRSFGVTPLVRTFAVTGILGGYTTFSTFSLDTLVLIGDGAAMLAAAYAAASVVCGVFAAYLGQALARIAGG
jgi:CrcB protein